ncbi:hypothetical protein [Paenibacillus sp. FSL L8-0463]|uniref:hypothetical protein n=1 Tax=Paenibacillus sp. FSL L8-0463 TaxID=2954687 RepID=UPI0031191F52
MDKPKVLSPGENETVSNQYGKYERYYLSEEELQKYREMPQDTFWDHHSKPHITPSRKTKGA